MILVVVLPGAIVVAKPAVAGEDKCIKHAIAAVRSKPDVSMMPRTVAAATVGAHKAAATMVAAAVTNAGEETVIRTIVPRKTKVVYLIAVVRATAATMMVTVSMPKIIPAAATVSTVEIAAVNPLKAKIAAPAAVIAVALAGKSVILAAAACPVAGN